MGRDGARWGWRRAARREVVALLAGLAVLGAAGSGLYRVLQDPAEELVAHGPFLVPRSLVLSSIPPAPALLLTFPIHHP